MEGQWPKNGSPLKIGYIFSSTDLVSLDTAILKVMGMNSKDAPHISFSSKLRVGSTKYSVVGDPLPIFNFKPATNSNIVMKWEMRLRRIHPVIEKVFFGSDSPFLLLLSTTADIYYQI